MRTELAGAVGGGRGGSAGPSRLRLFTLGPEGTQHRIRPPRTEERPVDASVAASKAAPSTPAPGEACDGPASQPVGPSPPWATAYLCGFSPLRCRPAIFEQRPRHCGSHVGKVPGVSVLEDSVKLPDARESRFVRFVRWDQSSVCSRTLYFPPVNASVNLPRAQESRAFLIWLDGGFLSASRCPFPALRWFPHTHAATRRTHVGPSFPLLVTLRHREPDWTFSPPGPPHALPTPAYGQLPWGHSGQTVIRMKDCSRSRSCGQVSQNKDLWREMSNLALAIRKGKGWKNPAGCKSSRRPTWRSTSWTCPFPRGCRGLSLLLRPETFQCAQGYASPCFDP